MTSTAMLSPRTAAPSTAHPRPLVFADGVPRPELDVESIEWDGLVGRSSAVLGARNGRRLDIDLLTRGSIEIAIPIRLAGDETHQSVLIAGRAVSGEAVDRSNRFDLAYTVTDAWTDRLDALSRHRWALDASGSVIDAPSGWLEVGNQANRSAGPFVIGGVSTYLPATQGESWSVEHAVRYLAAVHDFGVDMRGVSRSTRGAEIIDRISLSAPLDRQLGSILSPYGLWARRQTAPSASVADQIVMTESRRAAKVRLADPRKTDPPDSLVSVTRQGSTPTSQQWVARGGAELREGTFLLAGSWDASLESEDDSSFDREQSTGFATYANVFRRWVLNEDASSDAAVFDLSGFFGRAIDPRPIPFGDCLTLDDTSNRRAPVIEYSLDAGSNWTGFGDGVSLMRERAGVYLGMTTLPQGFIDAARSSQLRVRVTASLESPISEDVARWRGNPFFPASPPQLFDLRSIYRSLVVDASSIHRESIDAGSLVARERLAAPLLEAWLAARVQRSEQAVDPHRSRATILLRGWWWTLRPGDRIVVNPARLGWASGADDSADGISTTITRVRLRVNAQDTSDGTTEVDLLA